MQAKCEVGPRFDLLGSQLGSDVGSEPPGVEQAGGPGPDLLGKLEHP